VLPGMGARTRRVLERTSMCNQTLSSGGGGRVTGLGMGVGGRWWRILDDVGRWQNCILALSFYTHSTPVFISLKR
jgi:hypothetical protein